MPPSTGAATVIMAVVPVRHAPVHDANSQSTYLSPLRVGALMEK
jgi:hypothetical protein